VAVVAVRIADAIIYLTAWNPRDALAHLYCDMVLERARELMDGTTFAEARTWLEERVPDTRELFEKMDRGLVLQRDVAIGEFPVDPRNALAEARIVAHLLVERNKNAAFHEPS